MSEAPKPKPPVVKSQRIIEVVDKIEKKYNPLRHINKPSVTTSFPPSAYSDEELFKKLREQAKETVKPDDILTDREMTDKEIDDILFGLEDRIWAEKRAASLAQFSQQASPRRPKKTQDKPARERAEHLMQYPLKNHEGLQALLNTMQEAK